MPKLEDKIIYASPIVEIIKKIEKSSAKGIVLAGVPKCGKTTVLKFYKSNYSNLNTPIIDITLIPSYNLTLSPKMAKLYHLSSVIQKIILYIKANNLKLYFAHFSKFNTKIEKIIDDILIMYSFYKDKIDGSDVNDELLANPEILLDELISLLMKYTDLNTITVILDNFDKSYPGSYVYQTYLYNLLKQHLRVIATVSDSNVILNDDKLAQLSQDNFIIPVNYNYDFNTIFKILDKYLKYENSKVKYCLNFLFKTETIAKLIVESNGNIYDMISALRTFIRNIDKISNKDYDLVLLEIFKYIKINHFVEEPARKLYLLK